MAPVARRGELEQTWITGTFVIDETSVLHSRLVVATLTLHAARSDSNDRSAPSAPTAWNRLCKMLGGDSARITLAGRKLVSSLLLDGPDDRRRSGLGNAGS